MEDITLMFRSAVPIDDIDQLMMPPNDGFSIIWIDSSDRPDLNVLGARHTAGEDGFAICTWFYAGAGERKMIIGLRIEMRQPTRIVFHLAFKVEAYYEQLSTIARYGKFWIVPGPPPNHLRGTIEMDAPTLVRQVINYCGEGLMIELEPHLVEELRTQLATWKQARNR
jgi:hypothetical protein